MSSRKVSLLKRGFDFETTMWIFTRISALAMYLFALIALVGALVMGARTQMNLADLIRWMFTFYRPRDRWLLNSFKWDDSIDALF